jgi:gamma-glutamyltranspeptidase
MRGETSTKEANMNKIAEQEIRKEFEEWFRDAASKDLASLPRSQLAVLPGTTHVTLVDRADWLVSMITAFLDLPAAQAGASIPKTTSKGKDQK